MSKKSISKNCATTRLEIRLPISTKQKLLDMCNGQFTTSEMLRQIIESGELPDFSSVSKVREKQRTIEPLIVELARIGNNLNQLVRVCNTVRSFLSKYEKDTRFDSFLIQCTSLKRLDVESDSILKIRDDLKVLMNELMKWSRE